MMNNWILTGDRMDISKELTEIRHIIADAHNMDIPPGQWLGAMSQFQECNCRLCQAMIRITALEVNITMESSRLNTP